MVEHGAGLTPREVFVSARRMIRGWTSHGTYPEACALVMGYDEGRGRGSIVDGFQGWMAERYGFERKVAFWVPVARLALSRTGEVDASTFTPEEHAAAVDKLFELLIAYLDDAATPPVPM